MKKTLVLLVIFLTSSLFAVKLVSGIEKNNSITISWQLEKEVLSKLYYGIAGENSPIEIIEVEPEKGKYGYNYRVVLENLEISTRYNYWVEWEDFISETQSFLTSPSFNPGKFMFFVYSDTQHVKTHKKLAQEMVEVGIPALTLHAGDLNEFPFKMSWDRFFEAALPLLKNGPLFPVYGNHEMSTNILDEFFYLPNNERSWYSFDFGHVHFIALDTNRLNSSETEQIDWLRSDLENHQDKKWKIAFFHHPPFSPIVKDGNVLVREKFIPIFEEYGVHLVISGHSHVYGHYEINGIHYVVSGGGGGNLLTGGRSNYDAPFHYLKVKVSRENLLVTAIRLDGSIADTFIIESK